MGRSKRKVLHVAGADYAAYHILLPLLEGLAEEYDVTMACSPGPDLDRVAATGIKVQPIYIPRKIATLRHVPAIRALARFMRAERFDLVHTHTPMASILARPAARLAGVPLVVYTAHGFYFHDRMAPALYKSHVLLERALGKLTSHLITVSREDAHTAEAEGIMSRERISWIPNGIDLDKFDPLKPERLQRAAALRKEFGIRPDQPVVGMVARLVREKGIFDFVQAARLVLDRVPDVVFLCIGAPLPSDREDPMDALRQRVRELGIADRVIFPGFRKDVPDFLAMMQVFTLPSYREGLPLSLLEAMAMGLPSVVTNIRGCRELVVDGVHGRVVEPSCPVELGGAIAELLLSPDTMKRMGAAARNLVEAEYSLVVNRQRHLDLYRRLLASVRGGET